MQPIFNKRYNSFWFTFRFYDHSLPIQYHGGWPIAQALLNRIACSLHIPAFRSLESLLIVSMSWIPQLLPFLYIFRSVSAKSNTPLNLQLSLEHTLFQKHSVCWAVWVPAGLHCDPIRWKKINQAQPLHISVDRLAVPLGIWITRTGKIMQIICAQIVHTPCLRELKMSKTTPKEGRTFFQNYFRRPVLPEAFRKPRRTQWYKEIAGQCPRRTLLKALHKIWGECS